jgi:hypothetical protein
VLGDARTAVLLSAEELAAVERGLRMLLAGGYPAEPVRALLTRVQDAEREVPVAG